MNKLSIILIFLLVSLLVFLVPKETNTEQDCLGIQALFTQKNNPFSYISEELAKKVEVEQLYRVCFGIPHGQDLSSPAPVFDMQKFDGCKVIAECNGLVAIDCHSEVDGPFYYVEKENGSIVGECGGLCRGVNNNCAEECPPKQWSCEQ